MEKIIADTTKAYTQLLMAAVKQQIIDAIVNAAAESEDDLEDFASKENLTTLIDAALDGKALKTMFKSGKGKARAAKVPGAPKATNAWMMFSAEQRPVLKAENPDLTFSDMGKALGEKWRGMTEEEQAKYKEMAGEENERRGIEAKKPAKSKSPVKKPATKSKSPVKKKAVTKKKKASKKKKVAEKSDDDDVDLDNLLAQVEDE